MQNQNRQILNIAHSPDTDDIFMFYGLKAGFVPHPDLDLQFTAEDIGLLNEAAFAQTYDVTALSFHALALLQDKYALLSSGASIAENDYGPLVVAKTPFELGDLHGKTIAVPGSLTTAHLIFKMAVTDYKAVILPAAEILNAVQDGLVDAGIVIHEAQIHYTQKPLHKVAGLIDIWRKMAGSRPLPLGCSAVKKSLGSDLMLRLSALQKQSIAYAFEHRDAAIDYARQAAPELSRSEADRYLTWYANARTLHLGDDEREAITFLFDAATRRGLIPAQPPLEII